MRDFNDGPLHSLRQSVKNTGHLAKSLLNTTLDRVHFDPYNAEHRRIYREFRKTGRWEVYFFIESGHDNIESSIKAQLLEFALSERILVKPASKKHITGVETGAFVREKLPSAA